MKNKTKQIIPRGKQILVKPDIEKEMATSEGVYKPSNTEQEKKSYGSVISVGVEIKDVKKGDKVIFGTFAGDPIILDEVEYRLLHDEDVLAFLKD